MDLKVIKQVVELMKRSELTEFEIEEEGFKLRLSRKNQETQIIQPAAIAATPAPAVPVAAPAESAGAEKPVAEEAGISLIKSPMVGTFYIAASPESDPFVKINDRVGNDSVVCIIEAMKVMNEICAETTGTIVEMLVENGNAVEYGQPLFKVKKV